jgi:hypothetical protein
MCDRVPCLSLPFRLSVVVSEHAATTTCKIYLPHVERKTTRGKNCSYTRDMSYFKNWLQRIEYATMPFEARRLPKILRSSHDNRSSSSREFGMQPFLSSSYSIS